ncbi:MULTISPECIES: hypothetical protein [unclassified Leclercia]|uniref:hypothetical protein n=1 Tax=unclassified Leclercia TaxID=2627398 RepID=UPI002074977C|nr:MULTISPECIES: hypothetical protein [unclassified Leclercia]MCM5695346.1 hypothetical protein [Leclercia sp. LTM01]
MDNGIKHVEVNDKAYCIIRMSAFDAIHFNLRVAEILSKHGISQVESILTMSSKIFGVLNRADHDELLFTLLEKSRAQDVESGNFLTSWDEVNLHFTPDNIADVYLLALECLKLSILPVTAGLKKYWSGHSGNDAGSHAATVQRLVENLNPTVRTELVIWRVIESGLISYADVVTGRASFDSIMRASAVIQFDNAVQHALSKVKK